MIPRSYLRVERETAGEAKSAAAISPDGLICALSDHFTGIRLIDAETSADIRHWEAHSEDIWSLRFSPNGEWLLSTSEDDTIGVWEVDTGALITRLVGHGADVLCAAMSPDGTRIATGGRDTYVRLWDTTHFDNVAQLGGHVQQFVPSVVMTHGADGEYGHPAHVLMHDAVQAALNNLSDPPVLYTFAARVPGMEDHLWNQNEPAHLALDIRPWLDAKEAALQCHKSQHALFLRKRPGQTLREAARKVEAYHRHLPPVEAGDQPEDGFANLLRAAGAWMPDHTADT